MKKEKGMTGAEFEKQILEHPVKMYFRVRIGIREFMSETGNDTLDALVELGETYLELGLCVLKIFFHLLMLLFYPATKLLLFLRLRKLVRKHPGALDDAIYNIPGENKK